MIAVIVVANSGRLVHAAIIVAQIAHSDIHKVSAIKTAASTITSEAITNSHMLATSLVIFNSISFEVSLIHGSFLLKVIITNNKKRIAMNISLIKSIPIFKLNSHHDISIFMNDSKVTPINK